MCVCLHFKQVGLVHVMRKSEKFKNFRWCKRSLKTNNDPNHNSFFQTIHRSETVNSFECQLANEVNFLSKYFQNRSWGSVCLFFGNLDRHDTRMKRDVCTNNFYPSSIVCGSVGVSINAFI